MKDLIHRPACDERGEFLPWLNALRNQRGAYVNGYVPVEKPF